MEKFEKSLSQWKIYEVREIASGQKWGTPKMFNFKIVIPEYNFSDFFVFSSYNLISAQI